MKYNEDLKQEEIESLEETRSAIFEQIGKYEVQRQYYEEKIKIQVKIIEEINEKLYLRAK